MNRASFLKQAGFMIFAGKFGSFASVEPGHPDPRPGITAEHVLSDADIELWNSSPRHEKIFSAYKAARDYPEVFDGLSCGCGCTGMRGTHRSLLTCYETKQPTGCWSCQDEALMVAKLAADKTSLADIRLAVDKKY